MTSTTATATATELRDRAAACDAEAIASFDRCDTDGALSQMSNTYMATVHRLQADITEAGGVAEFPALFDLDGNLIPAKRLEGPYGTFWGIYDTDECQGRAPRTFNASEARKAKTARKNDGLKGYYVGTVEAPAVADLHGGNLLCLTAYARRTDGGFSREVKVIDNGHGENGGTSYYDW